MLHGTGIRIRGYGYGDTGKRHFEKVDLRGYVEYIHKCINKSAPIINIVDDKKMDVTATVI
jgi:hypothetical protein